MKTLLIFRSLSQLVNKGPLRKVFSVGLIFLFLLGFVIPQSAFSQPQAKTLLDLPTPGSMVTQSETFAPMVVYGLKIHQDNPFKFDFIFHKGDTTLKEAELKTESQKLIKYFLSALTIPEDDIWVNLNPYQQDKIANYNLGSTEMGRDLLAQDYLLKQLTASLLYPEKELGKNFWDRVYKKTFELFGKTDIPVNTFNKVWIVPGKAVIYEMGDRAFIMESSLKVMLEEDYLALSNNMNVKELGTDQLQSGTVKKVNEVSSKIVREVILPEIEKEINQGKNFAMLRQVYNSILLATWYKQSLNEGFLTKMYANQSKLGGIEVEDQKIKNKIYDQYIEAYQKGVYNYVKEDFDPAIRQNVPRNYFSGGVAMRDLPKRVQEARVDFNTASPSVRTGFENRLRSIADSALIVVAETAVTPTYDSRQSQPGLEDYGQVDFAVKNLTQSAHAVVNSLPAEVRRSPAVARAVNSINTATQAAQNMARETLQTGRIDQVTARALPSTYAQISAAAAEASAELRTVDNPQVAAQLPQLEQAVGRLQSAIAPMVASNPTAQRMGDVRQQFDQATGQLSNNLSQEYRTPQVTEAIGKVQEQVAALRDVQQAVSPRPVQNTHVARFQDAQQGLAQTQQALELALPETVPNRPENAFRQLANVRNNLQQMNIQAGQPLTPQQQIGLTAAVQNLNDAVDQFSQRLPQTPEANQTIASLRDTANRLNETATQMTAQPDITPERIAAVRTVQTNLGAAVRELNRALPATVRTQAPIAESLNTLSQQTYEVGQIARQLQQPQQERPVSLPQLQAAKQQVDQLKAAVNTIRTELPQSATQQRDQLDNLDRLASGMQRVLNASTQEFSPNAQSEFQRAQKSVTRAVTTLSNQLPPDSPVRPKLADLTRANNDLGTNVGDLAQLTRQQRPTSQTMDGVNPSGIDFNASRFNLQTSGEGIKGFDLKGFSAAELARMQSEGIEGLLPVIENIRPVKDLAGLLGTTVEPEGLAQTVTGPLAQKVPLESVAQ